MSRIFYCLLKSMHICVYAPCICKMATELSQPELPPPPPPPTPRHSVDKLLLLSVSSLSPAKLLIGRAVNMTATHQVGRKVTFCHSRFTVE